MPDNIFETQYDITRKSRFIKFYETNKISIFSTIILFLILIGSLTFYFEYNDNKKVQISENYIKAKINLEDGNKYEALDIFKKIILTKDSTYSVLAFFKVIDNSLIEDKDELALLYDYLITNIKLDKELKNLLIYKYALFSSNNISESVLLEFTKPLINSDSLWKPHTLIMLGDYFMSKDESVKAIEFYQQILSLNNLHKDFYLKAKSQLDAIKNE
jgi:predicted negative regulator of RcsB-dependent stress response